MKRIIYFFFLFLIILKTTIAIPDIIGVEGTIYDDYCNPIDRSVNVSLENLVNGMTIKGVTSSENPSYFKISLGGAIGDLGRINVSNREHTFTQTFNLGNASSGLTLIHNCNITLNMTISNNYPPEFLSSPITSSTEGVEYVYPINVDDYNLDDTITLTLIQSPTTMRLIGNTISWTPTQTDVDYVNANGPYPIIINATDGIEASVPQTYSLNVLNTNQAPIIHSTPLVSGKEETQYTYQINATDEDHDNLTYEIIEGPINMTINASGFLAWTPSIGDADNYVITLSVNDSDVSTIHDWMIFIGPKNNNNPIITSTPDTTAYAGYEYNYQITATDADNDEIMYYVDLAPISAKIYSSGILQFFPTFEDINNSPITFRVKVVDSKGGSDSQIIYLNVINETPPVQANSTNSGASNFKSSVLNQTIISPQDNLIIGRILSETENTTTVMYTFENVVVESLISTFKKDNIENRSIYFNFFNQKPANLKNPEMFIYGYFQIIQKDDSTKPLDSIITFKIKQSFFDENNLSKDDVSLIDYNGNDWVKNDVIYIKTINGTLFFSSKTDYLNYFAVGITKELQKGSISYIQTPTFDTSKFLNLTGIIYTKINFIQVNKMIKYKITNINDGKVYFGFTGISDKKNGGSFFNLIKANENDELKLELLNNKNEVIYTTIIKVVNTKNMSLNIYTTLTPSITISAIIKMILFILCLGVLAYYLKVYPFNKKKHLHVEKHKEETHDENKNEKSNNETITNNTKEIKNKEN